MSQMLKSSGALAAATMTSRVLGMVREMVYARFMGDGWVAGAFTLAFMVPNLFRRLLGEGALTAAFIPIFKEKEKTAGDKEMWRAASAVITGLAMLVTGLVLVIVVVIGVLLLTGAFAGKGQTLLMLRLLCVMFPYVPLVCLAAILMGMLNARGHFFVPAMGAAMLNLVMILSVLFLAPRMGVELQTQIFGLAIGVVVAGVIQAYFQWPILRKEGFRYQWIKPWRDETVLRVARQMLPGIVGVAAYQFNVILTQAMAFWLETPNAPIVASFNYAVRLMELPQGVFAVSMATYLLPTLSGLAADKNYPQFRTTLKDGLAYMVFVNLLASLLLVILAEPIVRLLFERGQFDGLATVRASQALTYLAPGLVAFSMVNILARAFFALGDTKTPMKISVVCLTLNVIFCAFLIFPLRHRGLGLANTASSCLNVALLIYALRRVMPKMDFSTLTRQVPVLLGATVAAGVAAWGLMTLWQARLGHASLVLKLGEVFVPALAATVLYFGISWFGRVPSARDLLAATLGRVSPSGEGAGKN